MQDRERPGLLENVAEANRVKEIFSVVIDATDPVNHDQFAFEQAFEPFVEGLVFGKPSMATQIKPITVQMDGTTQTANKGITLQDGNLPTVRRYFMSGSQAGGASPEDNGMFFIIVHNQVFP